VSVGAREPAPRGTPDRRDRDPSVPWPRGTRAWRNPGASAPGNPGPSAPGTRGTRDHRGPRPLAFAPSGTTARRDRGTREPWPQGTSALEDPGPEGSAPRRPAAPRSPGAPALKPRGPPADHVSHEPLPLKWGGLPIGLQAGSRGLRIPLSSPPALGCTTSAPLEPLRAQGFLDASRDASEIAKTWVVLRAHDFERPTRSNLICQRAGSALIAGAPETNLPGTGLLVQSFPEDWLKPRIVSSTADESAWLPRAKARSSVTARTKVRRLFPTGRGRCPSAS